MIFLILSLILFLLGAIFSYREKTGYVFASIGAIFSIIGGINGLFRKISIFQIDLNHSIILSLGADKLSSIFLIIAGISWFAISVFSINYGYMHKKESGVWLNLTFLGMLIFLLSQDAISLLIGWEIITICGFLMIVAEENVKFRNAYSFIAFGELSAISLLIGFGALFLNSGTTIFTEITSSSKIFLIFASIGFIIKMDIFPFHTWMKDVYKDAPTNVCAILSAPVTLMGVYGLIRVLKLNTFYLEWWLIVLLVLGGISAFWGALHAVATIGIRTLPAYSTIENNGIILIAISLSFLAGERTGLKYLSDFAFVSALIVAISHTLSKTLLFISTGHAKEAYSAHTIDEVRGVWKGVGLLPAFGIIVAGLSLSAFPPLVGYVGEWMILEGIFQSYRFDANILRFTLTFVGIMLALGMGLTAFSMIKFMGYTALGYHHEKKIKKFPAGMMKLSEFILIILIISSGILAPFIFKIAGYSNLLGGLLAVPSPLLIISFKPIFGVIAPTFFAIVSLALFIVPFFVYLNKGKNLKRVNSWNGGLLLKEEEYFTAGGFSYILEHVLRKIYNTKEFFVENNYKIEIEDRAKVFYNFFKRLFRSIGYYTTKYVMPGKIYVYIIYMLIMMLIAFIMVKNPF